MDRLLRFKKSSPSLLSDRLVNIRSSEISTVTPCSRYRSLSENWCPAISHVAIPPYTVQLKWRRSLLLMATGTWRCGTVEITPRVGDATERGRGNTGDFPVLHSTLVIYKSGRRLSTYEYMYAAMVTARPDAALFAPCFYSRQHMHCFNTAQRARTQYVR